MNIEENVDTFLFFLKEYDEDNINADQLISLQCKVMDLLKIINNLVKTNFKNYSPSLSLLYCGLNGNYTYSKSLSNDAINDELISLSNNISEVSKLSIKSWLLETKFQNKTLCSKLLETITISLKNESLTKMFLQRDAGLWLIFQLNYPIINDYSPGMLPIALNAADSYIKHVAIIGIKSLIHIARNTYKAQLRYYGQADLIYETLKKNVYTQDLDVLRIIIPCLLEFLQSFNPAPSESINNSLDFQFTNGYDELLRFVLQDLYICSNVDRKIILITHLNKMIRLMGSSMMKFMKQYQKSFETILLLPELHNSYPIVKEMMLENLWNCLEFIQPIIRFVFVDFVKVLIAFVDESFEFLSERKDVSKIVDLTVKVLKIFSKENKVLISKMYKEVEDVVVNKGNFSIFVVNGIID